LAGPPLHARLAVGLDEQLHFRFRSDLGADIAAIEHGATRLQGEVALQLEQGPADFGNGGNLRGQRPGFGGLQWGRIAAGDGDIEVVRRSDGRVREIGGVFAPGDGDADRAIEQPGVEMRQAVMSRKAGGQRALARSGRSIHGDDHGAGSLCISIGPNPEQCGLPAAIRLNRRQVCCVLSWPCAVEPSPAATTPRQWAGGATGTGPHFRFDRAGLST